MVHLLLSVWNNNFINVWVVQNHWVKTNQPAKLGQHPIPRKKIPWLQYPLNLRYPSNLQYPSSLWYASNPYGEVYKLYAPCWNHNNLLQFWPYPHQYSYRARPDLSWNIAQDDGVHSHGDELSGIPDPARARGPPPALAGLLAPASAIQV